MKVDGWSEELASRKIDRRIRYQNIEEDQCFQASDEIAVVNILSKYLHRYDRRYQGIPKDKRQSFAKPDCIRGTFPSPPSLLDHYESRIYSKDSFSFLVKVAKDLYHSYRKNDPRKKLSVPFPIC